MVVFILTGFAWSTGVSAQNTTWKVFINDEELPESSEWTFSRPADIEAAVLSRARQNGFLEAVLTHFEADSSRKEHRATLRSGPQYLVSKVEIAGGDDELLRMMNLVLDSREMEPFSSNRIENDVAALLSTLNFAGFWRAEVRPEITPQKEKRTNLEVVFSIEPGQKTPFSRIVLVPSGRSRPSYLLKELGVSPGQPLERLDAHTAKRLLSETGVFVSIGEPGITLNDSLQIVLTVPAIERAPGTFDVVLGYLPGPNGSRGSLVGTGSLNLANAFGWGRLLDATFHRQPGRVSRFNASLTDPFVLKSNVSAGLAFSGEQRDSTFNRFSFTANAGFRVDNGLRLIVSVRRGGIRPGAGASTNPGESGQIARATSTAVGLGVSFRRLDSVINPTRGAEFESKIEQVTKNVAGNEGTTAFAQQTAFASGQFFYPVFPRHVVAAGIDFSAIRGNGLDRGDYFRIGGASSLRGYDEDQFEGTVTSRLFAEYRYLLDRTSYVFLFGDAGFIVKPPNTGSSDEPVFRPGYGLGIKYLTPIGLMSVSYASNPDETILSGRVHIGVSLGI